ncbi:hypothetical protein HYPSUDRAFT_39242 [Hypholoma sublateritium FD-334 SS-4]|uniref:Uncharacterized protein n=1 Tax=Hypholoma sublateritium (strain FD-334 SS-4) TaxID=945553 RepID=A0A0D2PXE4_HYPSF|nr:hypothetical protein HYPSUDRAFT_39242 [Hypholoma sublateritium FD-334 SS-4]
MAIVEGQARYEALLSPDVFCASRRYVHDASAPLHPLPRHHPSRKKVIVEQMSYNWDLLGLSASAHMTTEQILPLIVVTFIFIDISEYLHSYDYDVQLLCD